MKVPETKISILSRIAHVSVVIGAGTSELCNIIFFQMQNILYGHMIATVQTF